MTAPNYEPIESNAGGGETPDVAHDSHAVRGRAQSEIDPLVDAASASGRRRPVNELEWFAEDDSSTGSPGPPRYERPPHRTSRIPAGMFRFAAASIAAFAFGMLIAVGMLRSFDYSPAPVAVNAPAPVAPAPVLTPPPAPQPAAVEASPAETLSTRIPPQP